MLLDVSVSFPSKGVRGREHPRPELWKQDVQHVWLNWSDVRVNYVLQHLSPIPTKSGHRASQSQKLIFE